MKIYPFSSLFNKYFVQLTFIHQNINAIILDMIIIIIIHRFVGQVKHLEHKLCCITHHRNHVLFEARNEIAKSLIFYIEVGS